MKRIFIGVLTSGLCVAHAQELATLGELLAKGGKRLSREEVVSLYSGGVTVSGIVGVTGRRKAVNTYRGDGTLSGRSTDLNGLSGYGLVGTWSISNEGEICTRVKTGQTGRDVTPSQPCSFVYKLNDAYYSGRSDDPGSAVYPRIYEK